MLFDTILFILFVVLFLFLPGEAFFKIFAFNTQDSLINLVIKISLGIILLTVVGIAVRYLGLPFTIIWLLPISFLVLRPRPNIGRLRPYLLVLTIITLGVVGQNIVLYRGGETTEKGLVFPSIHDTMWNIALLIETSRHFPPQHPGLSGEPLKNNHYFYPFFLSIVRSITKLDVFDLYFRLSPVLISFLFGLSLYAVSSLFSQKIFWRSLAVFLGFFSGGFAYLSPLFLGSNFNWKGDIFAANEPFSQIINPYSILGFTLFLLSIFTLYKATSTKQSLGWSLTTALFIGTLYGFKSFGGVISVAALSLTALYSSLFFQQKQAVIILIITLAVFIPVFLLISEPTQATLNWAPGWLLTEMMSGQDRLNLPRFAEIEVFYRSIGNTLGLAKIKLIEFVIYLVGNLGIRLLGLFYLAKTVFFPRKSYIFFSFLVAFLLPLLFNLGGTAYNIVQFTPYALLLLAILTAAFTEKIFNYFASQEKMWLGVFSIILIVVLALPVNIKNVMSKLEMPKDAVSKKEVEALTFLKDNSQVDQIVLIDPSQFSLDQMYVSALSERRVYLASPDYAYQIRRDPKSRIDSIDRFFRSKVSKDFLTKNNISYIYLLKPHKYRDIEEKLKNISLVPIFENEKVIIFGANK